MIMPGVTATETREAPPSHLHLKIESFSSIEERVLEKLESEDFAAGDYSWRLIIYPNGHGTEESIKDYVSVYLAISGTDALPENWDVNVVFSIFIFNQISGTYLYTPGINRRFSSLNSRWGYPEFLTKQCFTTPSNGYLVEDNCVFGAEVFVLENIAVTQCLNLKNVGIGRNADIPLSRVLEISNFSKIKDVWFSEEFSLGGYKWKVQIFPNGNFFYIGESLSIYLICTSLAKNEKLKASFSVCLKNQIDPMDNHKQIYPSGYFPSPTKRYSNGWDYFISLALFKQPGFLVNDRCLLEVGIFLHDDEDEEW